MTESMSDANKRCTVCGKSGLKKACNACIAKYGHQFDLTTPDGRFQARQKEQGSPFERDRRRLEKAAAERESALAKLTEKLDRANLAMLDRRYQDLAEALRGVEQLAKKIKELSY